MKALVRMFLVTRKFRYVYEYRRTPYINENYVQRASRQLRRYLFVLVAELSPGARV